MKATVVGYGKMGQRHAQRLRALGVEVFTVDPSSKADAMYDTLPEAPEADLIVVSVPPAQLCEAAVQACLRAPRVAIDKPMGTTVWEAHYLQDAADRLGTKLDVIFTERANPAFRTLKQFLPSVGDISHISVQRLGPPPTNWYCDVAVDLACHCFDMARDIGFLPKVVRTEHHYDKAWYLADIGNALMEVYVTHAHEEHRRTFTVVGNDGMLAMDKQAQTLTFSNDIGVTPLEVPKLDPLDTLWLEIVSGTWTATGLDAAIALELSLTDRAPC